MKSFNFKKMFLESLNQKTFPKHLLFGFHQKMFTWKPEWNYQFEVEKEQLK